MAIYGYTKNYKLIKPQFDTDTWHDYIYDNLDTIDAIMSAIYSSGNWQGFWKKNTHYDVGDVVIDRDTDTMYKVLVEHTTSENTFALEQAAHPTYYELWSPNNLAEEWAIKMDGLVSFTDYSSKAYAISSALIDAGSAKEWAIETGGTIGTTGEYSAKKHAQDSASSASTATSQASAASASATLSSQWAVSPTLVASTDYSSKSWATGSLDAGSAKDWAIKEGGQVGATGKYSAKVYSLAAENHYEKARDWASKTNGQVESTDYSAKAYAISVGLISDGSAKEWSNKAKAWATSSTIIEDGKYGASYYALQAYNANVSAQTAKTTAQEWASKTDAQVASTDYSSKAYAQSEGLISSGSSKEWAAKSATWAEGSDADVAALGGTHSAKGWVDNSQIWAEGTDEQVQALGGVHSSKVWAEQSTNANIALTNSPHTTNRILEIPQDIKLELNNGTLTIKEGTKGYNGNGLFYTVTSDITCTISENDTYFLYLKDSSTYIRVSNRNESGTSVPSGYTGAFFHTDTGVCNFYSSGTLIENLSLPIAKITVSNGAISSINQVFNGFGCMGATTFALPGKYAFADGKEDDGTYKTIIWENTDVLTFQTTTSDYLFRILLDYDNQNLICPAEGTFGTGKRRIWDADNNIWTLDGVKHHYLEVGSFVANTTSPYNIISFKTASVDSVANSNMSNISNAGRSFISGLGNPSTQGINLIATGAINAAVTTTAQTYIAPASGVIQIAGADVNYTLLICNGIITRCGSGAGSVIYAHANVSKGDTIYIRTDSGTATLIGALFVYANGEV